MCALGLVNWQVHFPGEALAAFEFVYILNFAYSSLFTGQVSFERNESAIRQRGRLLD